MLVENFISQMEYINTEVLRTFSELSPAQMNYRPMSSVWSVAQNFEHLIKANNSYLPALESIKSGENKVSFMGKMRWWRNMCGKYILKSVEPTRSKKIPTFPIWQPAMSDSSQTILDDFRKNQEQLVAAVVDNRTAIEEGVSIGSPANQNIVYTVQKALEIIVSHANRHILQAKEMLPLIQDYDQSKI
ncbi:MAG: hypothetical protein ACI9UJ_001297 [bacterium]|jgi:uncharacterized damage-inducible protein DinB